MGMETVVINKDLKGLQRIDELFKGRVRTIPLTAHAVEEEIVDADIVIGAVLVPGGRTPVLITRAMLGTMKKGSVIVDVSVDQGGCIETSKPTTHDDPVYEVDGIVHYCVSNMPGAYPQDLDPGADERDPALYQADCGEGNSRSRSGGRRDQNRAQYV